MNQLSKTWNAKVLAVPVGGLNGTDLFEQDIAAMCEAQQEEEDEQCEVEEVSDQDYDEIYRNYCATDVLWQGLDMMSM